MFYFSSAVFAESLKKMSDEELSEIKGQALLTLSNTDDKAQALNFYKLGVEADLEFNINIRKLQLGCGGINGANGCDIDFSDVSFGCVEGSSGECITLPSTNSGQLAGKDSNNNLGNQKKLKSFELANPYLQIAIKNAKDPNNRQIVGIQLGAENLKGPLSIGNINSYSGFLSGKANLTMQGERDVSPVTQPVARFKDASAFLGLKDANLVNLWILGQVDYRDLTVNYDTVSRSNLPVTVSGNRVTQAQIEGIRLGDAVNQITDSMVVERSCVRIFGACTGQFGTGVANVLLPLLKGGVGDYVKSQLAQGLNTTVPSLNNYKMPYNLANLHQVEIDSSSFGLALSAQAIKYPGADSIAPRGWSLNMSEALTLNIVDKTSNFVKNIVENPNAREGNIVRLPSAYRNCYGNLKFC